MQECPITAPASVGVLTWQVFSAKTGWRGPYPILGYWLAGMKIPTPYWSTLTSL